MRIIKIRNGSIRLENPIFGDNLFVGVLGLSMTPNSINIETNCLLKVGGNTIELKSGNYTIDKLNNIIKPLIISIKGGIVNIKSDVYFKLDEKLNKYLGFEEEYFNSMKHIIIGDFPLKFTIPNPEDKIIQINQECKFIIGRNGHIPTYIINVGLYSLSSLEKIFNSYPEKSPNKSTKFELENGLLKISSPFNIGLDSYLCDCLGFEYKIDNETVKKPNGEKYSKLFDFIWPNQEDTEMGKIYLTKTSVNTPKLNTEKYLSNIGGNVYFDNGLIRSLYRSNYTIEQINTILNTNIEVSEANLVSIKNEENNFMFDSSLCENLGIKFNNFLKIGNYPTSKLPNIPLELHCNLVEKSLSNHKENSNIHYEEDLLFIFNNPQNSLLIKPSTMTYVPVDQKKVQNIRLSIFDLEGNVFNKFTEFIVYLSLINRQ